MSKRLKTYIFLFVLIGITIPAYGTNHYVDKNVSGGSNNGSSWANAWHSFSAVSWSSIQPGDNIYISGGTDSTTYNETLTIGASGNANGLIVIRPGLEAGHNGKVIISASGTPVTISNKKYVRLEKITVKMDHNNAQGIYITGSSTGGSNVVYIDSCRVLDIYPNTNGNSAVLRINGREGDSYITDVDSTFIRYSRLQVYRAIPTTQQTDNVVLKYIQNIFFIGDTLLVDNDITGGDHNDCIATDHTINNMTVANCFLLNTCHLNPFGHNIITQSLTGNIYFYNNVMAQPYGQNVGSQWGTIWGIWSNQVPGNSANYYIYQNTFVGGAQGYFLRIASSHNNQVYIKNNIFNATQSFGNTRIWTYNDYGGGLLSGANVDGNLYNPLVDYNNNLQVWNGSQKNMSSLNGSDAEMANTPSSRWNVDPLFTNASVYNYSLQAGSPAIGKGVYLGAPYDTDINGNPRSNPPDIGAYQYTSGGGGNNPPNQPSNPNPVNAAINQPINLTLTWSCTDPDGDPLTYDVYFGTSSTPSLVSGNQSNANYNPGTLSNNTTYYWKIVAKDNHGHSTIGPVWHFTTATVVVNNPPNQPANPNPANGAVSTPTSLTLTWSCTDPEGDPLTYDVYFGISSNPSLVSGNQTNPSYNPGQLSNSTTYYWKIVAKDNHGHSTSGPVWYFSTVAGGDVTPPRLVGAWSIGNTQLLVIFSEAMNQSTIANKNNYSINHGITVYTVSVQSGNTKVILNTSSHSPNVKYTLTVNNVKDVAGNLIDPQHNTATYYIMNHNEITVTQANAQWFQDFKPKNAVDGIIDTTSESRWQGVVSFPDSIEFDLGQKDSIDETQFSFYGWNQGIVYHYSVTASSDGVNWTELVNNQISFSQEWTIDEYTPIYARYIKLSILNCNQEQYAGLWEAQVSGPDETTGVETNVETPTAFKLEQNYPNPFNPTTNINFSIPSNQNVKINVYNALGQLVQELVNQYYSSGNYSITFNASNLPSGVYIYRIETGSFNDSRKMILIK